MKFLRNLLAAIIGCLVAFGIIIVMFFIFVSLVGNLESGITVKENSVLELQIQRPIKDYSGSDPMDPFAGIFEEAIGLDDVLQAIETAKENKDIKGISIQNNFMMAGLAQTREIRKALDDFRDSGKFIYSFGDYYTQKDYYLASISDSVFLNPVGGMDFKGLSSEILYLKDLQEKTGIKMEVVRHGKYKSAVEPFLSNEMSEANRTQIRELLGSLWSSMLSDIAENRGLDMGALNGIADTLGGRTPKYALENGLVDGLVHFDQYEDKLSRAVGLDSAQALDFISMDDFIRYSNTQVKTSAKDKIAVVYAQGEILYGEGGPNVIGQGIITKALRKVKEDDRIKAVVLRVNSPGGSALTSDIIWREIELLKQKKPVVVSMGNLAASGGYYIACGADRIFAEPTTITGSIGVFGTIPNIHGLAGNIGINAEQVGTNQNSVDYSVFEPMTENFREVVREGVEETYRTFLDRVSRGRGISITEADSLAQGRVWSGMDAQKIGLVDELGTLDDAIAEAAKLAELERYGIRKYPKYKSGLERFMENFGGMQASRGQKAIEEEIGTKTYTILKQIKTAMEQKGIQARMPFILDIN